MNNEQKNVTPDVKQMLDEAQLVWQTAHTVVANVMQDGERTKIKELAQTVGQQLARDPKKILGFVHYFAHNTDLAYVTRGKKGGLIKGVKPVKVVKVSKRVKKPVPAPIDTTVNPPRLQQE
jgi:hypothetical protein